MTARNHTRNYTTLTDAIAIEAFESVGRLGSGSIPKQFRKGQSDQFRIGSSQFSNTR